MSGGWRSTGCPQSRVKSSLFMAELVEPLPQRKRRRWALLASACVGLTVLAALWFWFLFQGMRRIPDVAGGLTIDVEPGVRVFAGNHLLGTGATTVDWTTLFGPEGQAFLIPAATLSELPTAEQLAGPGATELQRASCGACGTNIVMINSEEWYLRRADGALDQVLVLMLDWAGSEAAGRRRYFMPLRIRAPAGGPADCLRPFGQGVTGQVDLPQFFKAFGKSPRSCKVSWTFRSQPATNRLATECKTKGAWEPAVPP
jgi:hypothetical protein